MNLVSPTLHQHQSLINSSRTLCANACFFISNQFSKLNLLHVLFAADVVDANTTVVVDHTFWSYMWQLYHKMNNIEEKK